MVLLTSKPSNSKPYQTTEISSPRKGLKKYRIESNCSVIFLLSSSIIYAYFMFVACLPLLRT